MSLKSKIFTIIGVIVSILLIISQYLMFSKIWDLSLIPTNLFIILLCVSLFICLVLIIVMLLYFKKIYVLKTIAIIISILIIVGSFFGSAFVKKVNQTFDNITQTTSSSTIGIYVLKDDPAQHIKDAANYTFGITQAIDEKLTQSALALIKKDINKEPLTESFDSIPQLIKALYSQQAKAIILSKSQFDHLSSIEGFTDIPVKLRLLKSYRIKDTTSEPSEIANSDITEKPFIIYISGSDTRSKMLDKSRSDVNILAAVNPKTKKILLLNTPRDYFIPNPALNNGLDKLTHCGLYGTQCSMDALSTLYGKPILGYVQINFTGFEKLIDTIGGIDVYSDFEFNTYHGDHLIKKGMNHLNGNQALCFVRERYSLPGGDNDRGKNQMKVIKAIVHKLSASTVIKNYSELLESAQGMFSTNISNKNISALVKMQLSDMAKWEVETYAVTGKGGMDTPASMYGTKAYVMYPDENLVSEAKSKLDKIFE